MKNLRNISRSIFILCLICLALSVIAVFLGHEGLALRLMNAVYIFFLFGTSFYLGELFISEKN